MNRLFVFDQNLTNSDYFFELKKFYKWYKLNNKTFKVDKNDLDSKFLIENKIKMVITNEIDRSYIEVFRDLKIINISIGNQNYSDINIDYKNQNNFFYNDQFSLSGNYSNTKLLNLMKLVEVLKWDSQFFGLKIGTITTQFLRENIIQYIEAYVKENNIKVLYYLCNCHDRESILIAENYKFNFVDIRIEFEKNILKKEIIENKEYVFKLASNENTSQLKALASGIYRNSRYYFDENFETHKVNEFYDNWIEKAIKGEFDDECHCLFYGNKIIGFCTVKYNEDFSASIGLFGISKSYQYKGLAKILLFNIFNLMYDKSIKKLLVVTQGRNYGAQRIYQKTGFLTKKTELWYHKWINGKWN